MPPADLLALACGSLVGFSLALIGGGGSILATPMLLYVVGLRDPHLAIGTSAVAVAAATTAARRIRIRTRPPPSPLTAPWCEVLLGVEPVADDSSRAGTGVDYALI